MVITLAGIRPGGTCLVRSYPRGSFPGGSCASGSCPAGNLFRGEVPRYIWHYIYFFSCTGYLSWRVVVLGVVVVAVVTLGGSCPEGLVVLAVVVLKVEICPKR